MRASLPRRTLAAWGDPLGPAAGRQLGTVLFLLLVCFVAFHDLGARSLHTLDLPRFGVLAREMIETGEWLVPVRYGEVYANKPPLHIWLVAAPSALWGEVTPFWVRLPSAIGLVLLVLATAAWGRLRGGSFTAGRAAALLVLGTYAVTRFAREGRPDLLATGLAVAATFFWDRAALGRGRPSDPGLAGLLLGLALLAKGPALLVLPLLVLFLPTPPRSLRARLRSARPLLVLGIAVAVAALWFVPAVLDAGWDYGGALLLDQAADRVAGRATHVEPITHYAVRFVDGGAPWTPLYLLALLLLFHPRLLGGTRSLVAAGGLSLVLFSLFPTKHLRYVVGAFALFALGVGRLVHRFLERRRGRAWPAAHAALGGCLGIAAVAGVFLPGATALIPVLVLLLLLAGVALALGLGRRESPRAACRRLVGTLLVAFVLLLHGYWIVRDRHRVRPRDAFDRAVAAALAPLPAMPVYAVAPLDPGHVFHGAPGARRARSPGELPTVREAPSIVVLVEAARRGEVEAKRGSVGEALLARRLGDNWPMVVLLRFPPR